MSSSSGSPPSSGDSARSGGYSAASSLGASDRSGRARSRWLDVRLAIGVVLVGASIAGVVSIVMAADHTVTVYAAADSLAVGDVVTSEDLVEAEVRLGSAAEQYLTPGGVPDAGIVITRTIGSGELVPTAAVGAASREDWASIVVNVTGELPRSVGDGTLADLWAASDRGGDDSAPGVVASGVTVVGVTDDEGMIAGAAMLSVELLVPRERIARVLQAQASGDTLSLIPAAVPLGG